MKSTMIVTIAIVAFAAIMFVLARIRLKNTPLVADNDKIVTLTDKNFQFQTKNKLILIDFWAAWCAPCRMMAPVLNDVASELPSDKFIGKVDIEKFQSLAQKFGVKSIPTLILLKDGKEINRFVGIKNKNYLLDQLNKVN
jgi:thioredoxin 1